MKFLRDRKVRDVLWQALATVAMVAVVWFFVQNASDNMVKAGIASGFRFLWRDSGIEVPFNLTGYKPVRHDPRPAVDRHRQHAAGLGRRDRAWRR